jgi:predicted GNAT family N-acyltransferase
MIRIELMPWERAREQASAIRFRVFVEEQGVPRSIEIDEQDPLCIHALAYDDRETPIGTGRLLPDGHIGRMAVLEHWRRRGVGGRILESLIGRARTRGDREILLSAQVHAVEFYRSHGFQPVGDIYDEAGIAHRSMRRPI